MRGVDVEGVGLGAAGLVFPSDIPFVMSDEPIIGAVVIAAGVALYALEEKKNA